MGGSDGSGSFQGSGGSGGSGMSTVGDSPGRRGPVEDPGAPSVSVRSSRGGNSPFDARRNLRCRGRGHPDRGSKTKLKRRAGLLNTRPPQGKRGREDARNRLGT